MTHALDQLKSHLASITRLQQIGGLLSWDQQTMMPPKATNARAEQMATLESFIHNLFTSQKTAELLAKCESELTEADPDSDEVRLVRVTRRDYDQATKIPAALVEELARHQAQSHEVWVQARRENNFSLFAPALEKMFALTRQKAESLGYQHHPYDALIDLYEPGMTYNDTVALFDSLKPALVELVKNIAETGRQFDDSCLQGDFPIAKQHTFTQEVVQALGYDLTRGRQDPAPHPFCSGFSRDDVRITTRFDTHLLIKALFASIHEAGHAMYDQGTPEAYEATPLAGGASLGVHESQSRFWENMVGRSYAFGKWILPRLQEVFPDPFTNLNALELYQAINRVQPSFIRVEADEVTYNLHILLRFELETQLLDGTLSVRDLPDAWNAKMQEYLGITPPNDALGCLQDIHWAEGLIGYFPTYTIGNLLSAQLREAMLQDLPNLETLIEQGEFSPILQWLRQHIHVYGRKFLPQELVIRATGKPLSAAPYLAYLQTKFKELYAFK
ncbi:carboxypeptidase M32 [Chthonomonas calidirosea]|uniref:carboxypeptidase M32 n=1 Tax=Chthonomonas calidirosea TaxID=454171 RepID=UPI0006EC446C|nr:carboxypeptidase M32 [Chthonomonas calidirosea]CEK13486.1 carboxypeptidase Taq [Chthonomonas calidirosea]